MSEGYCVLQLLKHKKGWCSPHTHRLFDCGNSFCHDMTTDTCPHLAWRYSLSCVSLLISNADGEVEEVVADRGEVVGCILFLGIFPGMFLRSKGITPHISSPRSFWARSAFISIMDDVSNRLKSTLKLMKNEIY